MRSVAARSGGPTSGARIVSSAEAIATFAAAPPSRRPNTPMPSTTSVASSRRLTEHHPLLLLLLHARLCQLVRDVHDRRRQRRGQNKSDHAEQAAARDRDDQ